MAAAPRVVGEGVGGAPPSPQAHGGRGGGSAPEKIGPGISVASPLVARSIGWASGWVRRLVAGLVIFEQTPPQTSSSKGV